MPRLLGRFLAAILVASFVGPSLAARAAPPEEAIEEAMPYLGYTLRLPAGWERVVGDPTTPVPSIGSIADRDQVTAQALVAAGEHIAADGGLLDPMGLWAVDPVSLLQLGVLAGQPYRLAADDLRAHVDASLAERASDLSEPSVEPVALPAGAGFRARYLNAVDLAEHVEYHLRTPTGRYLVVAASLPGLFDESLLAAVDRVAASVAPIPDSSADRPAPVPVTSSEPAADLLATLPTRVAGVDLERQLLGGESLVASTGEASGSLASSLGVLVDAPADLTLAIGVPATSDQQLLIAAYALTGISRDALDAVVETFPAQVWTRTRVGPRAVLSSVRGDGGRRTWLWTGALPNGDAVLYQVDATNAPLARAAIQAIAGP